jgi:hypothetical protein
VPLAKLEFYNARTHLLDVNLEGGFIMNILQVGASTVALGALVALASIVPAQAAPVQQGLLPGSSNVEMVRDSARAGYWHGYRGFRTERPDTRRHNDGYWYPLAAFGAESGSTGSIVRQPVVPQQPRTYCQNSFGGTNGDGSMPCDNGY